MGAKTASYVAKSRRGGNNMTTAVIGIGALGGTVARHLVSGGEPVAVAARDPGRAAQFARELGGLSRAGSVSEAIVDADAVVLAVMWQTATNLIPKYAELLDGKVVIDPSNPIALDESGTPIQRDGRPVRNLPEGTSSGAVIAGLLPTGVHYVKALGTLAARDLSSGAHRTPERVALLYVTDDDQAGSTVERVISVAGFDPVKAGGVADVGRIEMPGGGPSRVRQSVPGAAADRPPGAGRSRASPMSLHRYETAPTSRAPRRTERHSGAERDQMHSGSEKDPAVRWSHKHIK